MGRNLLLNVADHGFAAAGYDLDAAEVGMLLSASLAAGTSPRRRKPGGTGGAIAKAAGVMALVPPGPPVDAVIPNLPPIWNPATC